MSEFYKKNFLDDNSSQTLNNSKGFEFLPKSKIYSENVTPLEVLQAQNTPAIPATPALTPRTQQVSAPNLAPNSAPNSAQISAPNSSTTYLFYGGISLFTLSLIAGIVILIIVLVKKKKNKIKLNHRLPPIKLKNKLSREVSSEVATELSREVSHDVLSKDRNNKKDLFEDPAKDPNKDFTNNSTKHFKDLDVRNIFPTQGITENSEEATFARQYSYENLQDSMFSRQHPKPQRKAQSSVWDSNVQLVKEEIEKSGQSLEDYMANTNAPLPENLMEAWKTPKSTKKISSKDYSSEVPKYAEKEMPALVLDATQKIPMDGKSAAYDAMQEILKAKKRAKVLGVKLPDATPDQRQALEKWMKSEEKSIKDLATSLKTMI